MDQVETEVLFKQDNPDFSALSHTPNKEETLSNGTGLTATIGNRHYGGPQLQRSTKEPEAQTQTDTQTSTFTTASATTAK